MPRVTRLLAAFGALCVLPASVLLAGQPASADPVFHLSFAHTDGTTHLAKPNVDVPISTFDLESDLDLGTGNLTATAQIPDLTATLNALGFLRVTAVTRLVPVGNLTGTLSGSTLTASSTFTIQILRLSPAGLPKVNLVPRGCRTARATTATLTNTTPISLTDMTLSGSFTIPRFTGCGLLTGAVNLTLPGAGNALTLHLH